MAGHLSPKRKETKMKTYRKINALCACSLLTMALLPTSCSSIDDNLDDCFIDLQAEYELRLVTNEDQELARVLGDRPGIADALRQHLSGVFSDQGRDLNLSFYLNGTRQYQQTEDMNNASTKRVNMTLEIEDYEHLAIANIQNNNVVTLEGDNTLATTALTSHLSPLTSSEAIASQTSGIFTGRRSFPNMTWGTYAYHMPLYMANSAAAIVLDPRTCKYTDIKVYTTGFATSFSVADSTYRYDNSPLVRSESVAMPDTTRWLAFCGVSYPSKEPNTLSRQTTVNDEWSMVNSTRSRIDTDAPFIYYDCGEDLWQYECYVTMADGTVSGVNIEEGDVTKTTLTIRHPLRAGQLKVLRGYIDDNGGIRLYDAEVGVNVDLDWKPGNEFPDIPFGVRKY